MVKNNVMPPHTNRGVEMTTSNGLIACVDWLSITFFSKIKINDIFDVLNVESRYFNKKKINYHDYTDAYLSDFGISIYYCEDDINEVGIFLDIKGQGCRYVEKHWSDGYSWVDFFNLIKILGFRNITRLDVAIDDFEGHLDITKLYRLHKRGCMTSSAGIRTTDYWDRSNLEGKTIGETFYIGSNKSDVMFRLYDKLAERTGKKFIVDNDITFWNRYEVQTRGERALNYFDIIASGGVDIGESLKGIMSHYMTFRVKSVTDTRRTRWKVQPFWTKFLNEIESLKLTKVHPEINFYKTRDWLFKSVASNLSVLYDAYDQDMSVIESMISLGRERQSSKHIFMLEQFLNDEDENNKREEFYNSLSDIYTKKGTATLENDNSAD